MNLLNREDLGKLILRIGLGTVFFWFGIDKFFRLGLWIGWVPTWFQALLPVTVITFLYILGALEALGGILLFIGFHARAVAFIAAVFLFMTVLSSLSGELLVRDIGLMFLAIGTVIIGSGKYSLDWKLFKKY